MIPLSLALILHHVGERDGSAEQGILEEKGWVVILKGG